MVKRLVSKDWYATHWRKIFTIWVIVFSLLVAYSLRSQRDLSNKNHKLIIRVAKAEQDIKSTGAINRARIAKADYLLCTKIYGQIVDVEEGSLALATPNYYHKLLPELSADEIINLINTAKKQVIGVEKKFDPRQCNSLPTQKLIPVKHA